MKEYKNMLQVGVADIGNKATKNRSKVAEVAENLPIKATLKKAL